MIPYVPERLATSSDLGLQKFLKINSFSHLFESSSCLIDRFIIENYENSVLTVGLRPTKDGVFLGFLLILLIFLLLPQLHHNKFTVEVINAIFLTNFAEGTVLGRNPSEEHHNFYSSPNIFRLAESRRKRWVRHIARVRYLINAHINFRF